MKKIFLLLLFIVPIFLLSQVGKVGVNSKSPTETLHVNGTLRIGNLPADGATNAISTTAAGGLDATQSQTFTQSKMLVVDNNGVVGKADIPISASTTGPTKFISGILLNRYDSNSGGLLAPTKLIGGAAGVTYNIGTATGSSSIGGIENIIGTGYKVSQVQNGVFDIMFDTPFTQIYSLSANVYDTGNGTTPVMNSPQDVLNTKDQLQISFISNSIIRIKTGNDTGAKSSRSFTFSVSGR